MATEKLVCIRDEEGYYRTTESAAKGIMASDMTSGDWRYTTKKAWRRNGGKYIETPTFRAPGN